MASIKAILLAQSVQVTGLKFESFYYLFSSVRWLSPKPRYQTPRTARLVPINVATPGISSSPKAYPSAYAQNGSIRNALATTVAGKKSNTNTYAADPKNAVGIPKAKNANK
jgi:hypothetical protein